MPSAIAEVHSMSTLTEIKAIHQQTCTIRQACEAAQVSRRTIYNWLEKGRLRYVRTAGNSVRIFTESLFKPGEAA